MIRNLLLVFLGTIILSAASFFNRFPLLTENSGEYINSVFNSTFPVRAPELYGLFLTYASWRTSLWLVVFTQAFILSLVIWYLFRYFVYRTTFHGCYVSFIFFLALFSSASIITSTINPDVFACTSALCMILLIFARDLNKRDFFIIYLIAVVSNAMNVIYCYTIIIVIVALVLFRFFWRWPITVSYFKMSKPAIFSPMLVVLISLLLVFGLRYFSRPESTRLSMFFRQNLNSVWGNAKKEVSRSIQYRIPIYRQIRKDSKTFTSLQQNFNWEIREYLLSRQCLSTLRFKNESFTQVVLYSFSIPAFFCVFIASRRRRLDVLFVYCVVYCLLLFFVNRLFSQPYDLFWQTAWIVFFPLFIYISKFEFRKKILAKLITNKPDGYAQK